MSPATNEVAELVREVADAHDAIARTLRRLSVALLERKSERDVDVASPYSSTQLPPDCPSRERFRRLAAKIRQAQGAHAAWKVAHVWFVTRDAWSELRGARAVIERVADDVDAADALRRAGLRVVGGSK